MNIEWLKNKAKEKFYPITHSKAVLYDDSNKTLYDELQTQKADYIKNLSANGKTITYTKGDGVTGNFDIQVTAGDGNYIPLSGTETDNPVTGNILSDFGTISNNKIEYELGKISVNGRQSSGLKMSAYGIDGYYTPIGVNINLPIGNFTLGASGISSPSNYFSIKVPYTVDSTTYYDGLVVKGESISLSEQNKPKILHNVSTPNEDTDGVNKQYVDNNYLPLNGTTSEHPMTGSISQSQTENDLTCYAPLQMSMQETKDGNKRRTILTPYTYTTIVESTDETIAGQMQIEFSPQKNKHMIEISGSSDCIIRGIGEPNEYNDVANKSYVDSKNKITSLTLTADNWVGDAAPYTQTVSVEGITANDNPILVSMLAAGTNPDMQKKYNKAFGIISSGAGLTEDGSVTFCVYSKPTMDITIGLKGA